MSDEANSIDNIFGNSTPPEENKDPGATPPEESKSEEWRPGWVPSDYADAEGKLDPAKLDSLVKSWYDGRQHVTTLNARIKEIEAAANAHVPEQFEEYAKTMDWEALQKRAPNAYLGGGEENRAAMALLEHAHKHGIPPAKAHALIGDYYETLNGIVPEVKDADTLRKEAIAHLGPNGSAMNAEVASWLKSKAATNAFNEEEVGVIKQLASYGPGLSLLWRLSREGGSTAPPSSTGSASTHVDPEQEKREATKGLAASEADWARNKHALIARWKAAHPEAA